MADITRVLKEWKKMIYKDKNRRRQPQIVDEIMCLTTNQSHRTKTNASKNSYEFSKIVYLHFGHYVAKEPKVKDQKEQQGNEETTEQPIRKPNQPNETMKQHFPI